MKNLKIIYLTRIVLLEFYLFDARRKFRNFYLNERERLRS